MRPQDARVDEGRGRNVEERNTGTANDNLVTGNITALAFGTNWDHNNTVARQNEPLSSNAHTSTS